MLPNSFFALVGLVTNKPTRAGELDLSFAENNSIQVKKTTPSRTCSAICLKRQQLSIKQMPQ